VLDWSLLWDGVGRSYRYGAYVRGDKSAARPRSVVDLGAARTVGVWSPLTSEGSEAVPQVLGGWGWLEYKVVWSERTSRVTAPEVVVVRGGVMRGPIPQEHMSVRGRVVSV
jgi:hypothetical protein